MSPILAGSSPRRSAPCGFSSRRHAAQLSRQAGAHATVPTGQTSRSLADVLAALLPQQVDGRVALTLHSAEHVSLVLEAVLQQFHQVAASCMNTMDGLAAAAQGASCWRQAMVKSSTCERTAPVSAKVENWPVMYTPSSLRWPMLSCTAPWSFDVMSLLVHELQPKRISVSQMVSWTAIQAEAGASRLAAAGTKLQLQTSDVFCDMLSCQAVQLLLEIFAHLYAPCSTAADLLLSRDMRAWEHPATANPHHLRGRYRSTSSFSSFSILAVLACCLARPPAAL